jgi:cobalt-zinc-cadmium efflux system membrane fusion protein
MRAQIRISHVLLACLLLSACNKPQAASESPSAKPARNVDEIVLSPEQQSAAAIGTQPAVMSREPDVLRVRGRITLADDRTWRVGVRTVGVVAAVNVGPGDYVRKGQVLALYHADELREARAQYRDALAELERAVSAAAQAQRNLDRAQRLLELKAGSVQQVEMARQDMTASQVAIRKAQTEVNRVHDLLEDDLRVSAEPPANGEGLPVDQVPIFAPGEGYVMEKNVNPGSTVDLSSVAFVIGDMAKVWMLASVRQEDLGKIRAGQPAVVTLSGQEDLRFPGTITNPGEREGPAASRDAGQCRNPHRRRQTHAARAFRCGAAD